MSEQVTTGYFSVPTKWGGTEQHQYVKVEKVARGNVTSVDYLVTVRRDFYDKTVESATAELGTLAEGLTEARVAPSQERYFYEESPTPKVVVSGERPATDAETSIIIQTEAEHKARMERYAQIHSEEELFAM